jgi:MoaA/NifB/PqqE/SkfB family radical SAM enzyme
MATNDRYQSLLAARFGQRFLDYRSNWALASERGQVGDFPLSLDIAINSGCQLSCLMCPLPSRPIERAYAPMKSHLFDALMDQAGDYHLPALTLGLASEPLLNPNLIQMIKKAAKASVMDIRLGTNGLGLNKKIIAGLIDSHLTRLEISVDALDRATYQTIRPGGDFNRLNQNIEIFLNLRSQRNCDFPLLRLSFLILPQNEKQLEPFLEKWSDSVDLISIQKPIWFPGSKLPKPIKNSFDQYGKNQNAYCVQSWQRLGIDHLGRVWPCCSWYGQNLIDLSCQEKTISSIWRSVELEKLREDHLRGELPLSCQQCATYGAF